MTEHDQIPTQIFTEEQVSTERLGFGAERLGRVGLSELVEEHMRYVVPASKDKPARAMEASGAVTAGICQHLDSVSDPLFRAFMVMARENYTNVHGTDSRG